MQLKMLGRKSASQQRFDGLEVGCGFSFQLHMASERFYPGMLDGKERSSDLADELDRCWMPLALRRTQILTLRACPGLDAASPPPRSGKFPLFSSGWAEYGAWPCPVTASAHPASARITKRVASRCGAPQRGSVAMTTGA
jgi:hypothetical protein